MTNSSLIFIIPENEIENIHKLEENSNSNIEWCKFKNDNELIYHIESNQLIIISQFSLSEFLIQDICRILNVKLF